MIESSPASVPAEERSPEEMLARKNIEAWESFAAEKSLGELTDREMLQAFLAWNRYRAGRMFFQKTLVASHIVEPRAVVPWIKKVVSGEAIPEELQFLPGDASKEMRNASEAAFDALAFVEEYREKHASREKAA